MLCWPDVIADLAGHIGFGMTLVNLTSTYHRGCHIVVKQMIDFQSFDS